METPGLAVGHPSNQATHVVERNTMPPQESSCAARRPPKRELMLHWKVTTQRQPQTPMQPGAVEALRLTEGHPLHGATDIVAGDFRNTSHDASDLAQHSQDTASHIAVETSEGCCQIGRQPSIQATHVAERNIATLQEPSCTARRPPKRQLRLQKKDDDATSIQGGS